MSGATSIPRIDGIDDLRLIGRGGFAAVYRGHQPAFRRDVAVKVIQRSGLDEQDRRRFDRECQAMGALSGHPGIVTLYDAGYTDDGQPYLVMAHVPDGTLHDLIVRSGPLAPADAMRLGVRLSGALETAHRAGVLHRDIKPANVLRGRYGDQLSDFGIARIQGGHETQTGMITASVNHAAPEILDGQPPTAQADVYGLASTLYEALAGTSAFVRDTDEGLLPLIRRVVTEPPPDLRPRGVPAPLADVIETGMAKDPTARYPTAEAFGQALRGAEAALGLPPTELVVVRSTTTADDSGELTIGIATVPPPTSPPSGPPSEPPVPPPTSPPSGPPSEPPVPPPTMQPDADGSDRTTVMPPVAAVGGGGQADVPTTMQPVAQSAEPPPSWTPAGGDDRDSGGSKKAILIALGIVVALAAAGGAYFAFVADDGETAPSTTVLPPGSTAVPATAVTPDDTAPADTATPDSTAAPTSPPTTTATTPPPTTVDLTDPVTAQTVLDQLVADDASVVDSIAESWVPQLSAKTVGLEADGITYGPVEILQDHMARRDTFGAVLADGATYNFEIDDQPMTGWYITLVPLSFNDSGGALGWCTLQGIDRGNCFARFVSNFVFSGTTRLNP